MINATPKQLREAADIKERIETLQDELNELLGAPAETPTTEAPKKRKMSRAGRARIAAAARKRWAAIRAAKGGAKPAKKGKRKMSAAAKARLSALAKARWAKAKRAGKSRL